jgi:hypothetical protein
MRVLSLFMATCLMFAMGSTSVFANEDQATTTDNVIMSEDVNMTPDVDPALDPDAIEDTDETLAPEVILENGDLEALSHRKYKWFCWYKDEDHHFYKGWGWSKHKAKKKAWKKCMHGGSHGSLRDDDDHDDHDDHFCRFVKCTKKKAW